MTDSLDPPPEWRLARAREREHILAAIVVAQQRWREVGEIVAAAAGTASARTALAHHFGLDDAQAACVLDMQFRRLCVEEQEGIEADVVELAAEISRLERLVAQGL